ncbi:unnamed protein product [Rotaria sp. Silwood1]|nr:unnamed protein product [Rotaria sp. Silwood1]
MIDETGSINSSLPPGLPRTARTNATINKTKQKLQQNKVSTRKLALELGISQTSAQRMLGTSTQLRPLFTEHPPGKV